MAEETASSSLMACASGKIGSFARDTTTIKAQPCHLSMHAALDHGCMITNGTEMAMWSGRTGPFRYPLRSKARVASRFGSEHGRDPG
jgi:hypothetical protein